MKPTLSVYLSGLNDRLLFHLPDLLHKTLFSAEPIGVINQNLEGWTQNRWISGR